MALFSLCHHSVAFINEDPGTEQCDTDWDGTQEKKGKKEREEEESQGKQEKKKREEGGKEEEEGRTEKKIECWQGFREIRTYVIAGGNVNWCSCCEK